MALPAVTPETGFEEDLARALAGDKKQQARRDTLKKLAEEEPETFVRSIRTLMTEH